MILKHVARFFLLLLLAGQTYLAYTDFGISVAMLYITVSGVAFAFGYFEGTDWKFIEDIMDRVEESDMSVERTKPWN